MMVVALRDHDPVYLDSPALEAVGTDTWLCEYTKYGWWELTFCFLRRMCLPGDGMVEEASWSTSSS
jgi:hypothetical protein